MEKFDERQVIIRGKIMTRGLILTGLILLSALVVQGFGIYNIIGSIGFEDFIIAILLVVLTYICCNAILLDAFVGVSKLGHNSTKSALLIFTLLSLIDLCLIAYHLYANERISLPFILSFFEVFSISICLWLKRNG